MASNFRPFTGRLYQPAQPQSGYGEPLSSPGNSNHLRAEFYVQQHIGQQIHDGSESNQYDQEFTSPLSTPPRSQAQLPTTSPQSYHPPLHHHSLYDMPPPSIPDYINLGSDSPELQPPPPYGAEMDFGGTQVPVSGSSFGDHSGLNL